MIVDKPGFSMYNSRIVCSDKMHKAKREGIVFHGFREEMESMTKLKRVLCGTLSALMLVSMPLISGCSTKRLDNGDMSYHLCIHIRRPIQAVELQAMMDSYPQITAFSV